MRRRDFIKATVVVGAGLAIGITGEVFAAKADQQFTPLKPRFAFPNGGCTEAGLVMFDKGPSGADPFNIY